MLLGRYLILALTELCFLLGAISYAYYCFLYNFYFGILHIVTVLSRIRFHLLA